jgi:carbonic anhydrase
MTKPLRPSAPITLLLLLAGVSVLLGSPTESAVSPDDALAKLQGGNARYATTAVTAGKPVAARRAETAGSQHPFAIIVGCADSRTSPELLFDRNLGDLFVVRTAGNLVDEHALGSIEYAVEHLGARLIVVLGHERCGAVSAALASPTAPGHVNSLVRDIQPAIQAAQGRTGNALENAVKENAIQVANRIRREVHLGELAPSVQVVTAVYDLDTGLVEWAKPEAVSAPGSGTRPAGGAPSRDAHHE